MAEKVTIAGREFNVDLLSGNSEQIVEFLHLLADAGVFTTPDEQQVVQAMRDLRPGGELIVRRNGRERSDVAFFMETREQHLLMSRPTMYECKTHGVIPLPFCPKCSVRLPAVRSS